MIDQMDKAFVYMIVATAIGGTGMCITGNQQSAGGFFLLVGALLALTSITIQLEFLWNELKEWRGEGE